MMKRTYFIQSR